jgi:hypothetical protein
MVFMRISSLAKNEENGPETMGKYEYSDQVPEILPRTGNGVFSTIHDLTDNISRTSSVLITGTEKCQSKNIKNDMRIGERTFFISGTCGSDSLDDCNRKPRHIIVNNLPSGNFNRDTNYTPGSDQNGVNAGIIPSIIEDILELDPTGLISSLDGSNPRIHSKCRKLDFEEKRFVKNQDNSGVIAKTKIHKGICVPITSGQNSIEKFYSKSHTTSHKNKKCMFFIYISGLFIILLFALKFLCTMGG